MSVDRKGEKLLQENKARAVLKLPVSKNTERKLLIPAKTVELMGHSMGFQLDLAQIPARSCAKYTTFVTLLQIPHLSLPQFPHL